MPLEFLDLHLLGLLLVVVLGALIGSFANVVIYRLPRGESIAFPGSHCPACSHELRAHELVPVLSWVVQGARCRSCRQSISARYPLVEMLMAAGFALLWLRWPATEGVLTYLSLATIFAVLLILAAIDIDTHTLPDVLTLPALALALLAPLAFEGRGGLPSPWQALVGAALGAGLLALVNRIGGLVLRRFADTGERLWPLGFDQVNVAALVGALAGWQAGLTAAGLSLVANLAARRPLRLAEPVVFALWALALALSLAGLTISPLTAFGSSLGAAGAAAVAGALYWWLRDLATGARPDSFDHERDEADEDDGEPVAMGFGDVKLAALMGALLGPEKLLLSLFLAFVLGAVGGVTGRLLGGERVVPFGPYLVLAAIITLFLGDTILSWYLGLLGI